MKQARALLAVAAGVTVGLTFSSGAHAEEIAQVSQTRPNQAMLTSGAFALGAPYIASIIVAAESNHPGDKNLYVPVAGPWMDLGDRHCGFGNQCGHEGVYKGLLIADGIFQGIGALNIAGAFLFPETVTVTQAAKRSRPLTTGVHVSPASVGSGYGLAAVGAF